MYKILIRKHRRVRRMTQKQLAQRSGVSTSYISHLEKYGILRDRTPTMQCIESLAIALAMCPSDIIIYPCIECNISLTCTRKQKDMRTVKEIADEILEYYI